MKKKYISPELETQKFSFEAILAEGRGDTDDPQLKSSTPEDYKHESGDWDGDL